MTKPANARLALVALSLLTLAACDNAGPAIGAEPSDATEASSGGDPAPAQLRTYSVESGEEPIDPQGKRTVAQAMCDRGDVVLGGGCTLSRGGRLQSFGPSRPLVMDGPETGDLELDPQDNQTAFECVVTPKADEGGTVRARAVCLAVAR